MSEDIKKTLDDIMRGILDDIIFFEWAMIFTDAISKKKTELDQSHYAQAIQLICNAMQMSAVMAAARIYDRPIRNEHSQATLLEFIQNNSRSLPNIRVPARLEKHLGAGEEKDINELINAIGGEIFPCVFSTFIRNKMDRMGEMDEMRNYKQTIEYMKLIRNKRYAHNTNEDIESAKNIESKNKSLDAIKKLIEFTKYYVMGVVGFSYADKGYYSEEGTWMRPIQEGTWMYPMQDGSVDTSIKKLVKALTEEDI